MGLNSDAMVNSSVRVESFLKPNSSKPRTAKGKKRVVIAKGLSLPKPNSSKPRTAKGKKSVVIAKGLGKKRQFILGTVNARSMAHCREDAS
jgi:hypothetical protein